MLDEVEIIPVLHKVTGAGHSCKGGGGGPGGVDIGGGGVVVSEISVAWGKRGEGGQGREGVQLPDSLMDEAVLIYSVSQTFFFPSNLCSRVVVSLKILNSAV